MSARFDTTSLVSQLGLGCYWAWVALAFYSNASMIGAKDPGFWVESIWQYSTLFHGIALVAFALCAHRIASLLNRPWMPWVSAAGLAGGMVGFVGLFMLSEGFGETTALAQTPLLFGPAVVLDALVVGLSSGVLFLLWAQAFTRLAPVCAVGSSIVGCLIGLILYFVFYDFPMTGVGTLACICLPLISACCLRFLITHDLIALGMPAGEAPWAGVGSREPGVAAAPDTPHPADVPQPATSPLAAREKTPRVADVVVLTSCLFAFAFGGELLRAFSLSLSNSSINVMGAFYLLGGIIGISLLLAYWLKPAQDASPRFITMQVVRMTLVAMAAAFVAIPLVSNYSISLGYGLFGAGFWCFRIISWVYCLLFCWRFATNPLRAFGILDAAFAFSVILCGPVSDLLLSRMTPEGGPLLTVALAIAVVLMFISMFVLYNRQSTTVFNHQESLLAQGPAIQGPAAHAFWTVAPHENAQQETSAVPLASTPPSTPANLPELFDRKVAAVAVQFGLTEREAQVVSLMAQGRTLPYIQEALYISAGTAQTHSRHIYKKMSIHSRQELIDIVAQTAPDCAEVVVQDASISEK
ncbi:MAG: helix-turn-helix transcriptional regulator [Eggerthellales bacterium]|nr:helix-turn-helix transcriptional regulator [Eggerthellales bacterium]